ncbi:MAG: prepilin-type N-terminal cleavage/methylation domain-containing protein [Elusimicrobia bacterium]|nr:prepilin-type N-terminal cleavage/methylation domain-containing protein [Elusimicrobiota bacterium]
MTNDRGFTLTELITSMLISGIVVIVLGLMLVSFNGIILKGKKNRDLEKEFRFAKDYLQQELMKVKDYEIIDGGRGLNLIYPDEIDFDIDGETAEVRANISKGELKLTGKNHGALLFTNLENVKFYQGRDFNGKLRDDIMNIHTLQRAVAVHAGNPADSVVSESSNTFTVYMRSLDR